MSSSPPSNPDFERNTDPGLAADQQPSPAADASVALSDPVVQASFRRALRLIVIMGVVGSALLAVTAGWQTALLFLVGAAVSFTGIREWRNITDVVFDRFSSAPRYKPAVRTFVMFFLRLGLVAALLYVSLKYLKGNVYALVAGLGLAVVVLSMETVRLLRRRS